MIVVTGMHRSGTSFMCQLLQRLGIHFHPEGTVYEEDEWNEQGYHEFRDVVDLNSWLVTGFTRDTTRVHRLLSKLVYVTMPSRGAIEKRSVRKHDEVAMMYDKYQRFALKDPRFCLTFPVWDRVGKIDKVIVCLRHPQSVVESLARRDRLPKKVGYFFWEYHIRSLMDVVPVERSIFINVDDFSNDEGRQLKLLRTFLQLSIPDDRLGEIHKVVFRQDLWHFGGGSDQALPHSIKMRWMELQDLATTTQMACG